jgi:hypothetical protein
MGDPEAFVTTASKLIGWPSGYEEGFIYKVGKYVPCHGCEPVIEV